MRAIPRTDAPAWSSSSTARACTGSARASASQAGLPAPIRWPCTAYRSLTATLSPSSGPLPMRRHQRVADDPPDPGVERRRRDGDVGRGDPPAVRRAHPQLGLLAAAAALELGDRDDERVVVVDGLHVGLHDPALRRSAAAAAEGADLVVPDQQPVGVAAQRRGSGREEPVERRDVVGHQRALVLPERLDESVGHRCLRHASIMPKSALRIRACTPFTTSTTCEMSKSVAAER